jgi:hypothetical protein
METPRDLVERTYSPSFDQELPMILCYSLLLISDPFLSEYSQRRSPPTRVIEEQRQRSGKRLLDRFGTVSPVSVRCQGTWSRSVLFQYHIGRANKIGIGHTIPFPHYQLVVQPASSPSILAESSIAIGQLYQPIDDLYDRCGRTPKTVWNGSNRC